jgi:hypothetical protein
VRRLCCALLLLIAGCSREYAVSICSSDWWRPCKHFATIEEAHANEEEERQKALATARSLDIDYLQCAVVVLAAEIRKQNLDASERIYISIIGEDPPPRVLDSLAAAGIEAAPVSRRPPESPPVDEVVVHSAIWTFKFGDINRRLFGGYQAYAGYYCGPLCAGASEYQLVKSGDSCVIKSHRGLWVA